MTNKHISLDFRMTGLIFVELLTGTHADVSMLKAGRGGKIIEITDYLPFTRESFGMMKMLYPHLPPIHPVQFQECIQRGFLRMHEERRAYIFGKVNDHGEIETWLY